MLSSPHGVLAAIPKGVVILVLKLSSVNTEVLIEEVYISQQIPSVFLCMSLYFLGTPLFCIFWLDIYLLVLNR